MHLESHLFLVLANRCMANTLYHVTTSGHARGLLQPVSGIRLVLGSGIYRMGIGTKENSEPHSQTHLVPLSFAPTNQEPRTG